MLAEGNPVSDSPRPVLPLAATRELAENSRQGFAAKKIGSHRGSSDVNFKSVTGIEVSLRWKGIRSRCQSLNRYAYALNNPTTLIDPMGLNGADPVCMLRSRDNIGDCGAGYNATMGGGGGGGQEWNIIPIVNCDSEGSCTTTWQSDGLPFGGIISVTSFDFGPKAGPADIDINLPGSDAFGLSTSGCSAPAGSSGLGRYASGLASAVSMFSEFLTGLGPGNQTFGPASVESQMMSTSPGVSTAVNNYLAAGQTSGLYTFGLGGLWDAGINPIQQFVGSYRWNVVPTNGGLSVTLTNTTSVWSGSYHLLPNHSRSSFGPLGNTYQTYQVFVPCN
jgi:hypothetical protein